MTPRKSWVASAVFVAVAALATYVGPYRGLSARSSAIGSVDTPYVLSTPLFTPTDGSNSTLVFASMNDSSAVVNLRRYNAVGGLLSSTHVTLGAKSSIIAFAGANSGAQMHIEIWSPTPNFTMELTYTDPGNAVQKIPYGDMFQPRGGGTFQALAPFRACDTRVAGPNCPAGTVGPGGEIAVKVTGVGGLPTVGVTAVTFNLTVTGGTAGGYLTAWPDGTATPTASSLNFSAGQTIANMITVKVGTNGTVRIGNALGQAHVVVDLAGFYAA
jgi:hypothetical protein